ncbi:efflux RND transporter permease subunit [Arsukibacterium sp.]|uniref:efflux RND transporter permease subunit n=1 Tax=Arsukibacterium sp. TaxID=1977258 RepID=UPI00299DA0B6|nr:efflux RND transporter permease subunit [Arsukibacterium sp.]MDX1536874.1 efflux RND transporter permease subunit [Arsukibacterium sp.]
MFLLEKASHNRVFANLLAIFLLLAGLVSLTELTVKLFPTLDLETISVTVPYPGATPAEVEEVIIKPIEQKIEGQQGVRRVRSVASQNIGSVVIELYAGEDKIKRLNDIKNQIDQIRVFPEDAEEPRVVVAENDELAIQFVLFGDTSGFQLKQQAQRLRTMLADADGISDVRLEATADYLLDIQITEDTLRRHGLSLTGIARRIAAQSLDLSAGEIEGPERRLLVRSIGERLTAEQFKSLVVGTGDNGALLYLQDIASIDDTLTDSPLAGFYNNQPAIVISAYRVGQEQILDLVTNAKTVFNQQFVPSLPADMQAEIWRDESDNLRSRISLLTKNAAIGLVLVVLLLMLFLEVRLALWVAAGLVVAFVGSFSLVQLFGYSINMMSIFGFILVIGIVVDDAIVVGENVYSKLEDGLSGREAAAKGVVGVATPVLVSILTTIAVFIPLLFIPSLYGQFLGPIAAIVIFVLLLSLVEAFYILPKHLSHLNMDPPGRWSPRHLSEFLRKKASTGMDKLRNGPVKAAVGCAIHHPLLTVGLFIAMLFLIAGLFISGAVKFIFFPEVEGNYVTASVELSNQTSETQTRQVIETLINSARQSARQFNASAKAPDGNVIQGILATRGKTVGGGPSAADAEVSAASNLAYVSVKIEDAATRQFGAVDFERTWREITGAVPGARKLTFTSSLVSAGAAVQLEVRSANAGQREQVVAKLRQALEDTPGVLDVRDDRFDTTDEVQIRLKPEALVYGLTLRQLAQEIRASYYGAVATRIARDREEIEVRVRLSAQERGKLEDLLQRRILVNGSFIPVAEVADIHIAPAPSRLNRLNGQSVTALKADVDNRIATGSKITRQILEQKWSAISSQYPEVQVTVGGDQAEQERVKPSMARNFLLSLFMVYALLALVFSSYSQPLVIMAIIPFGLTGAVLGHFMLGLDLTLLSLFGLIGLSGVVINDSLLLMEFINRFREKGQDIEQAVLNATLQRFRAIVLTSLTTFLGVTPIILEPSVQATFLKPTAVSLGIGILFATTILLLLLPALAVLQLKLKSKLSKKDSGTSEQAG